MTPPRGSAGNGALSSFVLKAAIGLAVCGLCTAQAATFTWSSGSSWTKASNWANGTVPGPTDTAEFDSAPGSGSGNGVGPTFVASSVNNSTFTGSGGGPLPDQAIGAISLTSARNSVGSLFIGSTASSGSSGGYMTFNGATIGGVANTILSDLSTQNLHIVNAISGSGICGVVLGTTTNVIQISGGSTSSAGSSIDIVSTIDQVSNGSSISLLGGGSSTVLGGILDLSGTAATFNGGITIGKSDGTQGGTVEIDTIGALPTAGAIVVNNNSELLLTAAGTYGGLGQSLTLNGQGIAASSSSNVSGALRATASLTWQGNVTIGSNAYITPSGSNVLTLSGTITDNGNILQKQGSGTLILSNAGNNMSGSTNLGNGTLTVNAGSSIGTGALQMAQSSTNNTALNLNNATQTVSSLSSSFSATTGTETQVITLGNSTALTINQTGNTSFGNAVISSTVTQTSTITGGGSVTLGATSTGALTFTGTQTYTGGTQINAGTLYANGAMSGTVNVQGGELGGSGAIAGLVTGSNGGVITAGGAASTIGELTLQSGLNLSNGGNYTWDLASDTDDLSGTAGISFDQLEVTGGALTLGGSSALTLDFLAGVNASDSFWNSNHSWTIISALGGSSIFGSITDPTYDGGTFSTADTSGQVTLNYQAGAVPEPSTVVAIGLGAALLLASRRRRR
jgi:autotransporter-associated beta strand protein